jgi:hypothetical protein
MLAPPEADAQGGVSLNGFNRGRVVAGIPMILFMLIWILLGWASLPSIHNILWAKSNFYVLTTTS